MLNEFEVFAQLIIFEAKNARETCALQLKVDSW